MRSAKVPLAIMAVLTVSLLFLLPVNLSESAVDEDDVGVRVYDNHLELNAGSSGNFQIVVVNYLAHSDNDIDNYRMVSVSFIAPEGATITVDDADRNFVIEGKSERSIVVNISVDRYATADTYDLGVVLSISSLEQGSVTLKTDPVNIELVISSPLSSGEAHNKILGIFKNPLPAPFDGPLTSAVITFILWILIGALVAIVAVPLVLGVLLRNHKEEEESLRHELKTFIPVILVLFAFTSSLRVFGASEEIIGSVESWFNIFYIILGAIIIWKLYLIFIQYTVSRMSKNTRVDQQDIDIGPLLKLLGKLAIAIVGITVIMSSLGFNLTAIVTSAGIVSLGITLGAQNILNQFFSGMVLLITHPFRSGDLVKIGSSSSIYKVSSVNIMNTVFQNWDNEETVIMPNNAVSSSTIVNLTGDGLIYKVTVYMNVAYDTDIDFARSLMEKAALNHPNVITNGSVDMPSTRVTAFLDSSIELRLTGYVYDFNDSGRISGELREAIFKAFKANGIEIPFPQMDVHLNVVSKERQDNDD